MTKDRRLGRGLAALLGTPLEEDGVLEGGAIRGGSDGNSAVAVAQRPTGIMLTASAASDGSTPKTSAASLPASASAEARTSVTGSVPLHTRASAKRASSPAVDSSDSGSAALAVVRTNESAVNAEVDSADDQVIRSIELNVCDIDNNPFQPRRRFNESEIASLAESIREHEQLQPILVRQVGGRYQLISGERRLRATIHAGRTKIRAEVREADDRLVAELAIVENLQRKDLDPIEKAMSFRRYLDEHQCLQEDLAQRLKIDRSTIANLMRLLELPDDLRDFVQNGKLSSGHARTLLPLGHEDEQRQFARQIMDEGWTVRETERRVAAHLLEQDSRAKPRPNASRSGPRKRDTPHVAALEQQLRQALGTKAEVRQQKSGRGKFVIHFNSPEEFERLFALMAPQNSLVQSTKRAA